MLAKQRYIIAELARSEFCSGELLGQQLGVTRSAVAKHIKALQQMGIDVYSVPGRGYRLANTIDLLAPEFIASQLKIRSPTMPAPHIHDILDSTNQYLLDFLRSPQSGAALCSGQACLAEMQTAGRGRRGRTWVSPFASSVYCSMYWRLSSGIQGAMGLSLMVGICIADVLTQLGVPSIQLKWPNDIYVGGRKLGGILVELVGQVDDACDLVIGFGLNVALSGQAVVGIDQPWVDLQQVMDKAPRRNILTVELLDALYRALQQFEAEGFTAFKSRWQHFDMFDGKAAKLLAGDHVVRGVCRGVDSSGALLLQHEDGALTAHMGGELSLRTDE